MHRQAFIITATTAPDTAIASEASLWSAFLSSPCGGGWRIDEICILKGPSREEALAAIAGAQGADYSLVLYLGSGELVKGDVPWAELSMRLAGGAVVTERELNTGTVRLASFFNCSHEVDTMESDLGRSITLPKGTVAPAQARAAYEAAVGAAEMGLVTMVAKTGGVSASIELISAVAEWCEINGGILSFPEAVELANRGTKKVVYRGGRRLRDFPLAVGVAQ